MANRARIFLMLPMLAMVLAPVSVRAADEPVATAPIPPPLPTPAPVPAAPIVAKPPSTKAQAKPAAPAPQTKAADSAARKKRERKIAAAHRPHRKAERRLQVAHTYPPPRPAWRPPYYRGAPVPELEAEGPSLPPPWYDWGRPMAAYPYPGPRGPMPPW